MTIEIDDFRVVAHDMANLMTIAGSHYACLLDRSPQLKDDSNFSKLLSLHERMFEQISVLQRTVEQAGQQAMVSMHRAEELMMESRFKYVRENIEQICKCYNLQVFVDTSRCPETVKVWSNLELARVVSENILRNASQAGAKRVFHTYIDCGDYMEVIFCDDGCGMSPEVVRRLGLGHSSLGRGEGIRMIKKLIASVGGTVEWRSIENIGTEVIVRVRKVLD